MPSTTTTKRSRRTTFADDDEDDEVVAQASSSRNEGPRKKARKSAAGPSKASSSRVHRQQSEESDGQEEKMKEPQTPPATQYEMLRDGDFEDIAKNVDEDDYRATQRLLNRDAERLGDNRVAPNGVLECITCFNFMCHVHLKVELGPLLNFIVGENGSGKSAILTAITLCLGGKASSTNRGASLRSFIKEGENHASLLVQIKNQGSDAFKPDLFGESVIVERHFSKAGSSGFKLKSAAGRIISTKKGDVDEIVEYYCLQVDNPLNVLSQDNARQFLNAASPSLKYGYFLRGTQLEQIDNDLKLFNEILDGNEIKLEEYKEMVDILKDKFERAQKLKESISQNQELRDKAKVYRNQLAWSQVEEQETILQEMENRITLLEEEIQGGEQQVREKSENLEKHDKKIQIAEHALEEIKESEGSQHEKQEEAESKFKAEKAALEGLHVQQRDSKGQLDHAAKKVKDYERKIEDEERRLEEANGDALGAKKQELQDARNSVQHAKDRVTEHANTEQGLVDNLAEADREAKESSDILDQKKQEIGHVESRIRTLSQNTNNIWAGYENRVPSLLKLIEQDQGFHHKPIGPMGLYIQLTKPKWSTILEKVCGQNLNAFIVGDWVDRNRLQGHMDRLGIHNCPINIRKPEAKLPRLREPDESFETVQRVLNFDDERVRDMMIITVGIEQLLLVAERVDAERVMIDGHPPENVNASISFHDHPRQRGQGLRITNRNGNLSTAPIVPDSKQRPRMKSDSETQISMQKELLSQLQSECQELEATRRRLQQYAQKCSQAITNHKKQANILQNAVHKAEVKVLSIERELDEFEGVDAKLQGLREELKHAKEQQEHFGQQYGELTVERDDRNKVVQDLKKELKQAKEEVAEFNARVDKAESKVRRYESMRHIALQEKNQAYERLELAKVGKQREELSRGEQLGTIEQFASQAKQVSEERAYIPEGMSRQGIERKFQSIKDQIKKAQQKHGKSEEQINNEFSEIATEWRSAVRYQKKALSLQHGLKNAFDTRIKRWKYFRRLISATARTNFAYLLSERDFRGQLLLDHKTHKLEVKVEPDQTRQNVSGRNTKTLSGGEKSFSSICLLLAIWDAIDSPIRCLDEFDVFMDNVNRAISTNMLISAARRSVGKQFILITPNAIEGRGRLDKDVKIIRLTDPRQTRLDDHVSVRDE